MSGGSICCICEAVSLVRRTIRDTKSAFVLSCSCRRLYAAPVDKGGDWEEGRTERVVLYLAKSADRTHSCVSMATFSSVLLTAACGSATIKLRFHGSATALHCSEVFVLFVFVFTLSVSFRDSTTRFIAPVQIRLWGPPSLLKNGYQVPDVALTTHPCLALRLKKG